jgi:hypothetical protein
MNEVKEFRIWLSVQSILDKTVFEPVESWDDMPSLNEVQSILTYILSAPYTRVIYGDPERDPVFPGDVFTIRGHCEFGLLFNWCYEQGYGQTPLESVLIDPILKYSIDETLHIDHIRLEFGIIN